LIIVCHPVFRGPLSVLGLIYNRPHIVYGIALNLFYSTNTIVADSNCSSPLIWRPTTGHDPESLSSSLPTP